MTDFEYQIENFMLYSSSKGLAKKTLVSYEQSLKLFCLYAVRELGIDSVEKVKTNHIRHYISYLKVRGKYTVYSQPNQEKTNVPQNRGDYMGQISNVTIANYVRNIKVFFNWLYKEHEIRINPCLNIENIRVERKCKKLLEPNDFMRLLEAFDRSSFSGYRNHSMTMLLLDCGCRISECVSIRMKDLDLKRTTILITNPKNKKERYVYFSPKMAKILNNWLKYKDKYVDSDYLFPTNRGTVLSIQNYEKSLKQVGKRLNIDVHPHQLRNNFAKYYILNGGDWFTLSRILGHSSVETTQKAYLDFTDDEVARKYQKHSPIQFMKY